MRRLGRRPIELRRRIFLGCEGESELGYCALLRHLCDIKGLHLYIDAVPLGGGDPLAIIKAAKDTASKRAASRDAYQVRAVLLDADRLGQNRERDARIADAAPDFRVVWQEPCHEALLLRHLPDCHGRRPSTCRQAKLELVRQWPSYEKPMSRERLELRIDCDAIRRAAGVEPDFADFLGDLGFLPRSRRR